MNHQELRQALDQEVDEGRVTARASADGFYTIYNYSASVQYDRSWNRINRMARGIIFDNESGEIVARPFPKFHNLGEYPEEDVRVMGLGKPEAAAKLDGSLGILFYDRHNDQVRVSTRGSLDSEQARWATEWLHRPENKDKAEELLELISSGYTPLVEIVYPDNRIVVDYGDKESLMMIGLVRNSDGHVMSPSKSRYEAERIGLEYPEDYSHLEFEELLAMKSQIGANDEGWVLSWEDPDSEFGRSMLKVKGDEYLKVHKLRHQLTPKAMVDLLASGDDVLEMIKDLPDEFHKEAQALMDVVLGVKDEVETEVNDLIAQAPEFESRKDAALWAQRNLPKEIMSIFFNQINGQPERSEEKVWKIVRDRIKEIERRNESVLRQYIRVLVEESIYE